jgi:hypothetical protein
MNKEKLLECVMVGQPKPLTDEQIAEAEKKMNLRFPAEFKRFVAKWNDAEFNCYNYFRLFDLTNIPDYLVSNGLESGELVEGLLAEVQENKESFSGIAIKIDPADVDLFNFADDGSEQDFYLMIDRKDPERYWIFDRWECVIDLCVDSVAAFLNQMLVTDETQYYDSDDRTQKQKLADWIYGDKPEAPARFVAGSLDDAPPKDGMPVSKMNPDEVAGQSVDFILPTGLPISMEHVPAGADASRQFWISRLPVDNERFLPVNFPSTGGDDDPAAVSASDAESFCAILNDFFAESLPDGYAFALPSEAEYQQALQWEKDRPVKPAPGGALRSLLKLFIRPNSVPMRPAKVLLRRRQGLHSGSAGLRSGTEPEKLPFYIVLTSR